MMMVVMVMTIMVMMTVMMTMITNELHLTLDEQQPQRVGVWS